MVGFHPILETIVVPGVDHTFGGDPRQPGVRYRIVAETELRDGVCIAVEREKAAGIEGPSRKFVVDVLPVPVAVQLDCDIQSRGLREDGIPVSRDAGTAVEHAPPGVAEDGDTGRTHGVDHPGCLVVRFPQS